MQNSSPMDDGRTRDIGAPSERDRVASVPQTAGTAKRRPYEAPRIERRIPVLSNTLQGGISGGPTQIPEDG